MSVIVGYAGSGGSRDALALGRRLAGAIGARLVVAYVYFHDGLYDVYTYGDFERAGRVEAGRVLDEAADAPGADMVAVGASSPARGLLELAEERGARALVVGTGDVAGQLLNGGPCTVAVMPEGPAAGDEAPLRAVAVAFDGSRQSRHALDAAVCVAAGADARVNLVGVAPNPPPLPDGPPALAARLRGELEDRVAAALQGIPETVRGTATVVAGDPVDGIVAASDGADLLVCGSRRYGQGRQVFLGSTSAKLVRRARCPLLVVPRGRHMVVDPVEGLSALSARS